SLIVGNDGLVISSTVDPSLDKDVIGAMSLAIHSNSDMAAGKLSLGAVREVVLQSNDTLTVLKKLDDGIMVVLSESPEDGRVDGLLKLLASIIKGKPEEGTSAEKSETSSGVRTQQAPGPDRFAAEPKGQPKEVSAGKAVGQPASFEPAKAAT